MGACCTNIKQGDVSNGPRGSKQATICKKCDQPLADSISHRCLPLKKLSQMEPVLGSSQATITLQSPHRFISQYGAGCAVNGSDQFCLKKFKTKEQTQTQWVKEPSWVFPPTIQSVFPDKIKTASFQQKLYWFRVNIEALRVSWQTGSEMIKVDRSNVLMSTKEQLMKANLRKEVKIDFNDEVVDDAGGLLREWMHLTLKEIFSPEHGIFEMTNCAKELAYRFKWDDNLVDEFVVEYMKVLGLIVGKAIFDRISISCYLDRTILRQICCGAVHLQDVYTYDESIYKTLHGLLNRSEDYKASSLFLDFCVYHTNPGENDLRRIELIPNGEKIMVKEDNKEFYSKLYIKQYCITNCQKYVETLRQSIYKVIPYELLQVFEPIELEMLLCGPNRIDIADWRTHTLYEGYKASDKEIKWFWEFIEQQNQDKLRNLLHYVTGTTRVPILGFKYLESNRNQVAKFNIRRIPYDQNESNPYPRSHTCFNRLELPAYESKAVMHKRLQQITNNEITHFGLS